jgi:hypothetical protein
MRLLSQKLSEGRPSFCTMTNTEYAGCFPIPPLLRLEAALDRLAAVDLVELSDEALCEHLAERAHLEEEIELAWQATVTDFTESVRVPRPPRPEQLGSSRRAA